MFSTGRISTRVNRSMQDYLRDKVKRRKSLDVYSKQKLPLSKAEVQNIETNQRIHDAVKTSKVILHLIILMACLVIIYMVLTKYGLS